MNHQLPGVPPPSTASPKCGLKSESKTVRVALPRNYDLRPRMSLIHHVRIDHQCENSYPNQCLSHIKSQIKRAGSRSEEFSECDKWVTVGEADENLSAAELEGYSDLIGMRTAGRFGTMERVPKIQIVSGGRNHCSSQFWPVSRRCPIFR
jgi:hypothetical protein